MSEAVAKYDAGSVIEKVLIEGDLSKLTPEQRVTYYNKVCESLGLNPLTKPFDYIELRGKLTLYAKKDATDQLRKRDGVSVTDLMSRTVEGVYIITAKAKTADGREDMATGAVNITNLRGDNLANAMMKAETKAKRRVTLSICGLGFLDETETETIPASAIESVTVTEEGEIVEGKPEPASLHPVAPSRLNWWPNLVAEMREFGYDGHQHIINALKAETWDQAGMTIEHAENIKALLKKRHEDA